jgi:predicted ArsR family transcriptional regulator
MMGRLPEAYPDQPGFKAPGPSEQAASAVAGTAKTLRDQVFQAIAATSKGLTADEVAAKLGKSVLSVRPRVAELHRQGKIHSTRERSKNASGTTATVWAMTPWAALALLAREEQR